MLSIKFYYIYITHILMSATSTNSREFICAIAELSQDEKTNRLSGKTFSEKIHKNVMNSTKCSLLDETRTGNNYCASS